MFLFLLPTSLSSVSVSVASSAEEDIDDDAAAVAAGGSALPLPPPPSSIHPVIAPLTPPAGTIVAWYYV